MTPETAESPTPRIIEEINKVLEETIPENMEHRTVEGIALKIGISKNTHMNG